MAKFSSPQLRKSVAQARMNQALKRKQNGLQLREDNRPDLFYQFEGNPEMRMARPASLMDYIRSFYMRLL